MDNEALKVGKPVFATEREADYFRLASHYRAIVQKLIERAKTCRALWSDSLIPELRLDLARAPGEELLRFQPQPMATAPRDVPIAALVPMRAHPVIVHWRSGIGRRGNGAYWADLTHGGAPCEPVAWVPVDVEGFFKARAARAEEAGDA